MRLKSVGKCVRRMGFCVLGAVVGLLPGFSAAAAPAEETVRFIGRFFKQADGVYRFNWSASTILAGFEGTGIAVTLRLISGTVDYFNLRIDGGEAQELKITADTERYVLAEGLEDGMHSVSLEKRSEGSETTVEFAGFDYGSGRPAAAPPAKKLRFEFVGDSITAGFGNLGTEPGYRIEEQDAGLTYGAMTAQAFDAEYTIIAASGTGLYQNLGGNTYPNMPANYYDRTLLGLSIDAQDAANAWDFSRAVPDVMVINLGTNDGASNVKTENYSSAYHAFLDEVRTRYPDTFLVCALGPMVLKLQPAVEQVVQQRQQDGDERIVSCIFRFDEQDGMWGAGGHPTVKGHRQMADELIALLKETVFAASSPGQPEEESSSEPAAAPTGSADADADGKTGWIAALAAAGAAVIGAAGWLIGRQICRRRRST